MFIFYDGSFVYLRNWSAGFFIQICGIEGLLAHMSRIITVLMASLVFAVYWPNTRHFFAFKSITSTTSFGSSNFDVAILSLAREKKTILGTWRRKRNIFCDLFETLKSITDKKVIICHYTVVLSLRFSSAYRERHWPSYFLIQAYLIRRWITLAIWTR